MEELYFRDYLSRFDEGGSYRCSCGQTHGIGTRKILFGRGILSELADLAARRLGSGGRIWILSDENTEIAAGAELKRALRAVWGGPGARARVIERILPGTPKPEPTRETVAALEREAQRGAPALLVSVGGGTISDIVKKISYDLDLENWCVVTSPSVDAYTSGKAAIWIQGYHSGIPARASEVVACDLGILEGAPEPLFFSGLGDLLGKYLAFLDWHISHLVTGEHLCREAAELSLASARRALSAAESLSGDRPGATRSLADAILTSGLLMQSMGYSRPAASAEHTIAHFWEMSRAVRAEQYDLHGILVAAAGRLVLHAYGLFFGKYAGLPVHVESRLEAFRAEPEWTETVGAEMRAYRNKLVEEMADRALDEEQLKKRLRRFERHRVRIAGMAGQRLAEMRKAMSVLDSLGFPLTPASLGLTPERAWLPFPYERYLRNRYTAFDLMYELGCEERVLRQLHEFVAGGG